MKKLALTFDDGPYGEHPQANGNWTNKVRRIVEDFNQKLETSTTNIQPITVTFFMQAEHIRRNPTTFRLIRDAGLYEIGNHAWIHGGWLQKKGNTPYLVEEDTAFEEFEKAHAEFLNYGVNPTLFRPPQGVITETLWSRIKKAYPQYKLAGWDCHPEKGSHTFKLDLAQQGPSKAAVYLLHEKKAGTVQGFYAFLNQAAGDIFRGKLQLVNASEIITTDYPKNTSIGTESLCW